MTVKRPSVSSFIQSRVRYTTKQNSSFSFVRFFQFFGTLKRYNMWRCGTRNYSDIRRTPRSSSRSLSGFETPLCGRIAFMADSVRRPTLAAPGLGNGITAVLGIGGKMPEPNPPHVRELWNERWYNLKCHFKNVSRMSV